jgi:hypothetical protein
MPVRILLVEERLRSGLFLIQLVEQLHWVSRFVAILLRGDRE